MKFIIVPDEARRKLLCYTGFIFGVAGYLIYDNKILGALMFVVALALFVLVRTIVSLQFSKRFARTYRLKFLYALKVIAILAIYCLLCYGVISILGVKIC